MVRVSVEVREGAALFRVAVQAESISRAVSIVKGGHPGREVRVVFPLSPGGLLPRESEADQEGERAEQAATSSAPFLNECWMDRRR